MIETIEHNGNIYPKFQSSGNAARFVKSFAEEVCIGYGIDIGCNRMDWCFKGATPIDPALNEHSAMDIPFVNNSLDYIHSSHCLEHLDDWIRALDYWHSKLKSSGVMFLYLPDFSQTYWRGWHNTKHRHSFTPKIVGSYFKDQPDLWKNTFVSGVDLNSSFVCISEKK